MARRLTKEGLIDVLDADMSWRRLELSALRTALSRASGPAEATAARTAVALSYAHWEGYVVTTGRALLSYVADLRLKYEDLSDPYLALCLAGKLGQADESMRRIRRHIDIVVAMRRSNDQARFPAPERAIQGEGNLKSEKLDDIITRLALDPRPFELHYRWLDSELLRRRNSIAHGAREQTEPEFGLEALAIVRGLLDDFRTAAQNAAVLEVFRR